MSMSIRSTKDDPRQFLCNTKAIVMTNKNIAYQINKLKLENNCMISDVLKDANLALLKLLRVNLSNMDVSGSNLEEAVIEESNLQNTILNDANLIKTKFIDSDLTGAKLIRAKLGETDFTGSKIYGMDLTDSTNFTSDNLLSKKIVAMKFVQSMANNSNESQEILNPLCGSNHNIEGHCDEFNKLGILSKDCIDSLIDVINSF